jgi:predicted RNA-binding protein YlqC (UPF0109 family)
LRFEKTMGRRGEIAMHIRDWFANAQQFGLESAAMAETLHQDLTETTPATDPRDAEVRTMLLSVVRAIVDEADKIELLHVADTEGTAFQVRSAATDVGKLIGKSGRTARAIRTILSGTAAKNRRRYSLDIVQ